MSVHEPNVDSTIDIPQQTGTQKFNLYSFNATALKTFSKLGGNKTTKKQLKDRKAKTTKPKEMPNKEIKKTQAKEIENIVTKIKSLTTNTSDMQIIHTLNENTKNELTNALKKTNSTITQEQALGIIDGALRSNKAPQRDLLNLLFQVAQEGDAPIEVAKYIEHMLSYEYTNDTTEPNFGWPDDIKKEALAIFKQNNLQDAIENTLNPQKNNQTNNTSQTNDPKSVTLKPEVAQSLLRGIINASSFQNESEKHIEIPDWACNLLVGAANSATKNETAGDVQLTEEKIPDWLSKVMRGIKPEAFQKIADHVITNQQSDQVEIITTLALAVLPEDDNKINESCMPFTALSGLLAIKNDPKGLNGADIVADIGQALIDADCNYKVDGEARWTNSRTTAFLKALNAIDSAETQGEQGKSLSDLAKDALCLCRNHEKLEGNAYKFDVAIQHIADEACEKPDAASATDSKTTTPKPIIAFLAECFVSASKDPVDQQYAELTKSMQNFKTDTETTLFQFKKATCNAIQDAMKSLLNVAELSNDQLQYFKKIKENRYNELSDDKIVNKMNEILELAQSDSLAINLEQQANLFPSMYVLEHVCILLNDQKELEKILEHIKKFNNQTISTPIYSQHKQTALDIISKHYSLQETNQTQQSETQTSENGNIIREQFNDFRSKNKGQSLTEIEIRSHEGLEYIEPNQAKDSPAEQIFTENRELKGVSGYGNNCLFYAICGQKTEQNADKYNAYALRQKYVEIQTTNANGNANEQQFKKEQADISCLPQMATHLNRPIIVLTKQTVGSDTGTGIQVYLPKRQSENEIQLPPITANMVSNESTTIEEWITETNTSQDHNAEFSALTAALKIATNDENLSVDEVKTKPVQEALNTLLKDKNVIALHFKGDTKNGHYQSFVPKEKNEDEK